MDFQRVLFSKCAGRKRTLSELKTRFNTPKGVFFMTCFSIIIGHIEQDSVSAEGHIGEFAEIVALITE